MNNKRKYNVRAYGGREVKRGVKGILSLVLITGMLLSLSAALPLPVRAAEQAETELKVGHTTAMNGNFFCELWGNNAADVDVRNLIHGYPVVVQTHDGSYRPDETAVRRISKESGRNGDVTYRITLKRGLKFSDGSPIGAEDYLFSFLLLSSPQLQKLTGLKPSYSHIRGFEAYNEGKSEEFSGLRLINKRVFTVTVKADCLPYFCELAYININPYPISQILPDASVKDDGKGAYISGEISAEILQKTLLDSEKGYISHPSVSSGPYCLLSYDAEAHTAEFEINSYYLGNFEGQKPSITRLSLKNILNEDICKELKNGEVDLVNKVADGRVVEESKTLETEGSIDISSYPRSGSSFLAIANERPVMSSAKLRQALAQCIDYEELFKELLKKDAERVYGYYGLGQWMPLIAESELLRLNRYDFDLAQAEKLLSEEGWTFNAEGGNFRRGDGLRCRKTEGGDLEPLSLKMIVTTGNKTAEIIFNMLSRNLGEIGGELKAMEIPFDEALSRYYSRTERDFDLFFLGVNFANFFDPTNTYKTGKDYRGSFNTSGIQDEKLAELAAAMTKVPSEDLADFLNAWLDFQVYWAEVLPLIPLYSNTYYDLYTPKLKNYRPEDHWNWSAAILYASLESE